jgi:hypothetical protein
VVSIAVEGENNAVIGDAQIMKIQWSEAATQLDKFRQFGDGGFAGKFINPALFPVSSVSPI